jgi:hypothetical protein
MSEHTDSITLRLEGERAQRGISLSDFETFIDSFISALRDFDRDQRGAPTRKSGHPEARAEAVAAFRLVGFREGSAIATIEPEKPSLDDEIAPILDAEPIQVSTLRSLLSTIEHEAAMPDSVTEALEKAVRSAGEDGSLTVEFDTRGEDGEPAPAVRIDAARIERIRTAHQAPEPRIVSSVSGRLHQVDFEPDKLAIRASDGVDWSCSFPEELEQQVELLVNRLVWASGEGKLLGPRRGTMALGAIRAVEQGTQTSLFSGEPISDTELAAAQGITAPQGLNALGVEDWSDADEAYLAALTED